MRSHHVCTMVFKLGSAPTAGQLVLPPDGTLPFLGTRVKAGQVLAVVQPHLVGGELLTYLNTKQQIQALEIEVTVRAAAADADAIRARAALTQAEQALRRMRALREQNAEVRARAGGG